MRVLDTHAMAKTGIASPLGRAILEHKHTKIGDNFNQLWAVAITEKFLARTLAPPQTTAVDAPHAPATVAKEQRGLAVAGVRRAAPAALFLAHAILVSVLCVPVATLFLDYNSEIRSDRIANLRHSGIGQVVVRGLD